MKKLLVATVSVVAMCLPAFAADLPVKAAAPPSPFVSYDAFSGPYIGVNVGYGWDPGTSAAAFQAVPLGSLTTAPQGFLGGIQAGYGQRFASILYAGIEGDIDGAALTGTATMPGLVTTTSKESWLAS